MLRAQMSWPSKFGWELSPTCHDPPNHHNPYPYPQHYLDFVKRSHEIQRSSQPEMWLHNPSEAKRKNTIIFSLVDHDCLLNMLPKKDGSVFSNLNPSISIYKKQHLPGFFSIIFIKHDASRVFHHHPTWDWRVPTTQLEIGITHPWEKTANRLDNHPPPTAPPEGDARSLRSGRSGRSVRSVVETPTGSWQWFERVGA